MDDEWSIFLGFGSCSELSAPDPRNPRLVGLKSVSRAAAIALRKPDPPNRPIGFHRPPVRR